MHTNVDLDPDLVATAQKVTGIKSKRALIHEALRRLVAERRRPAPLRLRKVTFRGHGLQPQLADASWQQIRDLSDERRGS